MKVTVKLTGQYSPSAAPGASSERLPVRGVHGRRPARRARPRAGDAERACSTPATAGGARRPAGSVYELDLSTTAPPDATAVVMNVTAADSTANGFVTVYPCDIARPTASNLNYTPRPDGAEPGDRGARGLGQGLLLHAHADAPDRRSERLVRARRRHGLQGPARRCGCSTPARPPGRTPVAAGGVYTIDLSGKVLPTAEAVTMNVTVTEPVADGFLTVYPCDAPRPLASNLNYAAGQTVPNLVTVKLSADQDRVLLRPAAAAPHRRPGRVVRALARHGLLRACRRSASSTPGTGTEGPLGAGRRAEADRAAGRSSTPALFNVTVTEPDGRRVRHGVPVRQRPPDGVEPQLRRRPDRAEPGGRAAR